MMQWDGGRRERGCGTQRPFQAHDERAPLSKKPTAFMRLCLLQYNNNNNNDRLTAFDPGQPG